jgi:hypothetical protein
VSGCDAKGQFGGPHRPQTGLSAVELSIALVLLAVLSAVALNRIWAVQADAERVGLEYFVGSLRSAVGIKVASLVARDDLAGIAALADSNPMDLLSERPRNYRGVRAGNESKAVEGGEWYFDGTSRMLVYRIRNAEIFRGGFRPPAEARFLLVPVYEDRNRNGRFDTGDAIQNVRLEAVRPYHWGPQG